MSYKDLAGADLHPPDPHTHRDTDLSSLTTLDGRNYQRAAVVADLATRVNNSHSHAIFGSTGLQASLDAGQGVLRYLTFADPRSGEPEVGRRSQACGRACRS